MSDWGSWERRSGGNAGDIRGNGVWLGRGVGVERRCGLGVVEIESSV